VATPLSSSSSSSIPSSMALSTSTTFSSSSSPYVFGGGECPLSKMKSLEPLFLKIFSEEAEAKKDEVYAGGKTKSIQAHQVVEPPGDILFRIAIDPDPQKKGLGFRYRRVSSSQIRELLRTERDAKATLERIRLIVKEWFKVTKCISVDFGKHTYDIFFTVSLIRNPSPIEEGEAYPMCSGDVFGITIGPWITRMKARPSGLTLEDQKKLIFMKAINFVDNSRVKNRWSIKDILLGISGTDSEFCLRISHYPVLDTFIVDCTKEGVELTRKLCLLGPESQIDATFPDVCEMIKEINQLQKDVKKQKYHMEKEYGVTERKL